MRRILHASGALAYPVGRIVIHLSAVEWLLFERRCELETPEPFYIPGAYNPAICPREGIFVQVFRSAPSSAAIPLVLQPRRFNSNIASASDAVRMMSSSPSSGLENPYLAASWQATSQAAALDPYSPHPNRSQAGSIIPPHGTAREGSRGNVTTTQCVVRIDRRGRPNGAPK